MINGIYVTKIDTNPYHDKKYISTSEVKGQYVYLAVNWNVRHMIYVDLTTFFRLVYNAK